jgi:hypothetical protein
MNPSYPVYIISKERWESRLTSKVLEKMDVPYRIVIEPQEYDQYAAVIDPKKILVLPFSNLGQGSIPARNWVWEHSISEGAARHWILDDNIKGFSRVYQSKRINLGDGTGFKVIEDFTDRYENIALSGMHYRTFLLSSLDKASGKPILFNHRVYSCILIKNDTLYRWRGRYNEDTDLSLRVLKDGWCTVLFWAFLADKAPTMTIKGGNTESLYKLDNEDGRLLMAQSLQQQHPDVTKITRKWGRWQHQVDYRPFKHNRLIKRADIEIPQGVNNYGMKLVKREEIKRPAEAGQGAE